MINLKNTKVKNYIKYLKVILVLLISLNNTVQAQCDVSGFTPSFPATVNGITITRTLTGTDTYPASPIDRAAPYTNACGTVWPFGEGSGTTIAGGVRIGQFYGTITNDTYTGSVRYNFSEPVNNVVIFIWNLEADYTPAERAVITTNNGGTVTTSSSNMCYLTQSGNTFTATSQHVGAASITVHSTVPFTQLTVTGSGRQINNGMQIFLCGNSVQPICPLDTAPTVNTTLANDCDSATPNTVNLADAHTGTIPPDAELVWFTDDTHTTAVADPTAVGAGTYYAFYFDEDIDCYSPASDAVNVTIEDCADCTDSGITSVDLNSLFDEDDLPHEDVVIEWWSTPTREPGTQVTDPTNVTVSGTYYAFFYDTVNDCYNTDNSTASVTVNILPPCDFNHCVTGNCNPNTFLNTGDPNTLEYDNFISGFHSSMIKKEDGTYLVWGQNAKPGVIGEHLYEPTEITPENGFNYAGDILKATLGTQAANNDGTDQYAVLTTEGLYIWGGGSPVAANQDGLVHRSVKNTQTFDKMTSANIPNANEYGLPDGVNPTDVKMLFGSYATLAITTCTGEAWVLSFSGAKNGDGTPDDAANRNIWHRVMKDASTPLNGVVAIRGKQGALMALTANGEIYTWGTATYLGDGTSAQNRLFATQMTLPAGVTPKMIGMTSATVVATANSYYLLSTSGEVYSLGTNNRKQLGTFDDVEQLSWVNVKSTDASTNLTNVVWISPNEHDRSGNAVVQALTAEGRLWGWGYNHANMLGAGATSGTATDPRSMYGGLNSADKILAVETGGHITTIFKDCDYKLGYIGHQINGSYANDNPESTSAVFQFDGAKFSDLCAIPLPPYPEVIDLEICEGSTADLADALQNTVPDGHTLEWWTTPNRATDTQVADPTEVEGGIYYAFFAGNCPDLTGEEVIVTENPPPVVPQDVANIKTFVNNDFEFTMTISGADSYAWEYATADAPTVWNTLDNTTFSGLIILDETTFRISHATKAIDGLRIRLKAVSEQGCEAYSNEILIEIRERLIITNPMMPSRARK